MTSVPITDDAITTDVITDAISGAPDDGDATGEGGGSATTVPADTGKIQIADIVRRRLAPSMPDDAAFSWIATAFIVAIAGILRLTGLAYPRGKIFDEIYYATEGHDLLVHGVEWNATTHTGDFVVHPPLGKWIIGLGEKIFGYNEFGWRFMPMIFGTLSILLLIRITRRLFRSTLLGCAAGLLMTFDGMEFVLSRTALLDIFLMFFILAAFGCLVLDRESRRRRWLTALENGLDPAAGGPAGRLHTGWREGIPWWRLAGGVMIGCAMSVKWSAIWYILLFVALIVVWEVGARRSAGVRRPWRDTLLDEIGWVVLFGVVLVLVYLSSWTGWLLTNSGYDRHYLALTGHHEYPIIGALQNLWHYHMDELHFHDGLTAPHLYQSWPWQWLLLGRPVAFYYSPDGGCGAAKCSAEVLLLGTPILWWSFLPALFGVTGYGIARRDWRSVAIFAGAFMGIAPWFIWEFSDRTMFYFYALPALPFLIMAVVYLFGAIMRGSGHPPSPGIARRRRLGRGIDRQLIGAVLLGAYLLVVIGCFAYFYPLYVGERITFVEWFARMWLGGRWI